MNDYGWDKSLNVKTMGRSDINEDYNHFAYEPTAYAVLLRLAERGYITKDNTLIDYGCGKGRVSFFLSQRTGCRTVGVEYDGDLIDIAVRNLRDFPFLAILKRRAYWNELSYRMRNGKNTRAFLN